MTFTRRDLLKAGAAAAALAALPRPLMAHVRGVPEPVPPITDPDVKELALKAVDTAKQAGATYADVRLTYSRRRKFMALDPSGSEYNTGLVTAFKPPPSAIPDEEALHFGVRALVNGYWGFTSSALWAKDEAARLGKEAVALAKVNALGGKPRPVALVPTPVVRDGHWETPVEIDPFQINPMEVVDYFAGLRDWFWRVKTNQTFAWWTRTGEYTAEDQQKAFASSDGSFYTQRQIWSHPSFGTMIQGTGRPQVWGGIDRVSSSATGWESIVKQPIREWFVELMDDIMADWELPVEPAVQVGRYDTVCDAITVAALLNATLAAATQLDRALGYEANATGTSYLNDPKGMLGSYEAGSPLLTLLGDRSQKGGCATVGWDDEGVKPEDFPLIKDGVLVDYQTTRESAGWLQELAGARATAPAAARSHGCAGATHAGGPPIQTPPNFTLVPGQEARDLKELMATVDKGVLVKSVEPPTLSVLKVNDQTGMIDMDFQANNGFMWNPPSRTVRIRGGKRVARVQSTAVMFRSVDLWKGLLAVGGADSVRHVGCRSLKGQPEQGTFHTVTAPAAVFKQLAFINAANIGHAQGSKAP